MKAAWCTDTHLNFLSDAEVTNFAQSIRDSECDKIFITGDISEADTLTKHLDLVADVSEKHIYFVLGNHDFYHSSIKDTVEKIKGYNFSKMTYLSSAGVVALTEDTALVGHDGWYDMRNGVEDSHVILNDFFLIKEMQESALRKINSQKLTDIAAEYIEAQLEIAFKQFNKVIVLTHVPPFAGASWHEGKLSNNDYLPVFSNKAVGHSLLHVMYKYPDKQCYVYCGHTHSSGEYHPKDNLHVYTGAAEYGKPAIKEIIYE